ncbi:nuclear transport factor 2 family protein [uncultured Pontibacter sp.]|uniref:YybH family protein n=1 Tax=uncultured Pontibacter sp. TaxID=453356 RepID=UPI002635A5DC|nr:nuclear transport factor 2 family protein [uncultured Pontibacter sp.]
MKKTSCILLGLFLCLTALTAGNKKKPKPTQELDSFLQQYVQATNSHDFNQVRRLLTPDAVYWFNKQESRGLQEIQASFEVSWSYLPDEIYSIKNITWLSVEKNSATCIYRYSYQGTHAGKAVAGGGRGTSVLVRKDGNWRIAHEHLSIPQ